MVVVIIVVVLGENEFTVTVEEHVEPESADTASDNDEDSRIRVVSCPQRLDQENERNDQRDAPEDYAVFPVIHLKFASG
jgi:hypothetical protein